MYNNVIHKYLNFLFLTLERNACSFLFYYGKISLISGCPSKNQKYYYVLPSVVPTWNHRVLLVLNLLSTTYIMITTTTIVDTHFLEYLQHKSTYSYSKSINNTIEHDVIYGLSSFILQLIPKNFK